MALQIKQGSEQDRLAATPEQGELVYTTDTKKVYVGDGYQPGGWPVGTGEPGPQGPTGPQGPAGPVGPQGA